MKSDTERIKDLEKRIEKLEKMMVGNKQSIKKEPEEYRGLVGGIQFLIDNEFFKKPVLVTEVQNELQKEGYFYSVQATDTILRRDYVKRKKQLNRLKIDGVWQYTLRK